MRWIVPPALETAVHTAARRALGEAPLATAALTRAIVDRSRRYTSEREQLAEPADRTADLAARAMFFTIADAMKIAVPLGELANRGVLPAARPLRIVDLGAGCGAMGLGTLATLDVPLAITAIDRDGPALAIARDAITAFAAARGIAVTVATRDADVRRTPLPAADLVVIGTLLNELPPDARRDLANRALAAIGSDGAVIAIEPALRDTSRALHELRDTLIAEGAHVFAPCTRSIAPCPALADPRDWCHEDRALELPPRTAELARLTHLRDSGMKFAYLVLRKDATPLVDAPNAWRLVSAPRPAKGKLEIIGCSAAGRVPLRLLRKHRTDANRALDAADRGDVIVTDAAHDGERVEITADHAADRIEPAKR